MLQKRRTHTILLALVAVLLLAAAGDPRPHSLALSPRGEGAGRAVPPQQAQDPEMVRRDLTLLLNRERELAGVPLLAPSGPLHAVAQARAEAIQAHGGLPAEAEAMNLFRQIQTQLVKAGYSAHGWTESMTTAPAGLDAAFEAWKREDPTFAQAMNVDYQNVGVGIAELGGHPLYVFLFAWPRSEYFARETAGLTDLQAVRQEMLDRINTLRLATGLTPLQLDPRLNTAAQAHAADMLARTYYNHVSPEGTTPRRRVQAAGFAADLVAENIAAGQTSVEDALGAWLHSTGHRRNLMDARLTHIGIGMAVGSYDNRYRVLWVQDFGRQQVWK